MAQFINAAKGKGFLKYMEHERKIRDTPLSDLIKKNKDYERRKNN